MMITNPLPLPLKKKEKGYRNKLGEFNVLAIAILNEHRRKVLTVRHDEHLPKKRKKMKVMKRTRRRRQQRPR